MGRLKRPTCFGFVLYSMLLAASGASAQTLAAGAQAVPATGTSVEVKMVDAVDSGSDPAGKQYRALVTKQVNAGGNVTVAQGAAAIITLGRTQTGWTAQLNSLVINGQVVAVGSSSANLSGGAQSAVGSAANSVGSVLGGFGRRANAPATVAAVASGQRVFLPPGSSLSFVLSSNPASGGSAPSPSSAATLQPSAATPTTSGATPAASATPPAATTSDQQPASQVRSAGVGGARSASGYTAPPATEAAAPSGTAGSIEFTKPIWALMTMRDIPQYFTDTNLAAFASAQISTEKSAWQNLAPVMGGRTLSVGPVITYEWQTLIDQQSELAGGPLLDVFLLSNPNWSFLNNAKGWDPNAPDSAKPVVEVYLFSREKIEGRQPDFAAQELLPVVKRQLEMAMKRLPTRFYFTEVLPAWKYDFGAKGIQFMVQPPTDPNKINLMRPLWDGESKVGYSRDIFNQLTPKARGMMVYTMASGEPPAAYSVVQHQIPPEVNPGRGTGWRPETAWKDTFTSVNVPEPATIALDRRVNISAIPMDAARAEQLTKLGGNLSARIYFTAQHMELEHPTTQLDKTTRTLLFASVEKVEILNRSGEVIATLDAKTFPEGPPPVAAAEAPKPAAQPAPQKPGETNDERVARQNREQIDKVAAEQKAATKRMYCNSDAKNQSGGSDPNDPAYKKVYDTCMQKP